MFSTDAACGVGTLLHRIGCHLFDYVMTQVLDDVKSMTEHLSLQITPQQDESTCLDQSLAVPGLCCPVIQPETMRVLGDLKKQVYGGSLHIIEDLRRYIIEQVATIPVERLADTDDCCMLRRWKASVALKRAHVEKL